MSTVLKRAKKALADLSEEDQEALVAQLEDAAAVRKLKSMIAEGRASIDRGEGRAVDIQDILGDLNKAHSRT